MKKEIKIDKVTTKAGRLIKVVNTEKAKLSNAKNAYWAVWVEDANGKNERCILLTDHELNSATHRAQRNKEDLTKILKHYLKIMSQWSIFSGLIY